MNPSRGTPQSPSPVRRGRAVRTSRSHAAKAPHLPPRRARPRRSLGNRGGCGGAERPGRRRRVPGARWKPAPPAPSRPLPVGRGVAAGRRRAGPELLGAAGAGQGAGGAARGGRGHGGGLGPGPAAAPGEGRPPRERPGSEVPAVLRLRRRGLPGRALPAAPRLPGGGPRAGGGGRAAAAPGRGGSAAALGPPGRLLGLVDGRVVVDGERHGEVRLVQLAPEARQAAHPADAGPGHGRGARSRLRSSSAAPPPPPPPAAPSPLRGSGSVPAVLRGAVFAQGPGENGELRGAGPRQSGLASEALPAARNPSASWMHYCIHDPPILPLAGDRSLQVFFARLGVSNKTVPVQITDADRITLGINLAFEIGHLM